MMPNYSIHPTNSWLIIVKTQVFTSFRQIKISKSPGADKIPNKLLTSIEEDLRPIYLTALVSKLLEGFTLKLLLSQVADQLDPEQFSLTKKSTTQAVVYMLHSILAGLESGQCSVRLFFC